MCKGPVARGSLRTLTRHPGGEGVARTSRMGWRGGGQGKREGGGGEGKVGGNVRRRQKGEVGVEQGGRSQTTQALLVCQPR